MISSVCGELRDQVAFDFELEAPLENAVPLIHISDPENVPGTCTSISGRKT